MKKKKFSDPFRELRGAAVGTAGLGLTTAIGAGISSKSPIGMTEGFNTLASFTPTINTAIGGKVALKQVKKLKKVF